MIFLPSNDGITPSILSCDLFWVLYNSKLPEMQHTSNFHLIVGKPLYHFYPENLYVFQRLTSDLELWFHGKPTGWSCSGPTASHNMGWILNLDEETTETFESGILTINHLLFDMQIHYPENKTTLVFSFLSLLSKCRKWFRKGLASIT